MAYAADERPNIIIILADDLGYSDIGCYGAVEIETPHLDRLAGNGLRYTQFYNAARCCPTRASLMTGLYPHKAGIGWMTEIDMGLPGYRGDLSFNAITIAELLREAGYRTYMTGKWHITLHPKRMEHDPIEFQQKNFPLQRGFDRMWGHNVSGGSSYLAPTKVSVGNEVVRVIDPDFYFTDAITDYTIEFIKEHLETSPNRPFFSYVAYTAPHFPLHAKPEDIENYRGRFDAGWDVIRERRFAKQKALGIVDSNARLSAGSEITWEDADDAVRADHLMRMEIYAAMVDSMDQGIGRIVRALEERGQLENTIIFFLSDNGNTSEVFGETPAKLTIGKRDSFESLREPWANVGNTPFREFKKFTHEGGIATPFIIHWPVGIPDPGSVRTEQVGHVIDLLPTCADLAQVQYPEIYKSHSIHPTPGKSLVPSLAGGPIGHDFLAWEHVGNRAIRQGDWKLVAYAGDAPWQLFNLKEDRTEHHDLAASNPEKVARLAALFDQWARANDVYPIDSRGWVERVTAIEAAQSQ